MALRRPRGVAGGVTALLTSVVIIQTGASFGKRLIEETPNPMAAVWLRLGTAGVCMLVFWSVRAVVLAVGAAWHRARDERDAPDGRDVWDKRDSQRPKVAFFGVFRPRGASLSHRVGAGDPVLDGRDVWDKRDSQRPKVPFFGVFRPRGASLSHRAGAGDPARSAGSAGSTPGAASTTPVSSAELAGSIDPALDARPPYALAVTAAFCVVMLGMNSTIYEAFDRLPVGIAITLEFLGPLGVAIAGSVREGRRLPSGVRGRSLTGDLALIACAGAGVALLGVRPVALNGVGVVFALVAAACWAGYILLGSRVSRWYSSPRVLTVAWTVALVGFALPALAPHGAGFLTGHVLGLALVVALSSSAVPTVLELFALGRVPPPLFAILESLAPAVAALAAWPLLGEWLHPTDWLAIGLVVVASAGATWKRSRPAANAVTTTSATA